MKCERCGATIPDGRHEPHECEAYLRVRALERVDALATANPCPHEEYRLRSMLRTEPLERFEVDSVGGGYESVWCSNCGALKVGANPWQLPFQPARAEVPSSVHRLINVTVQTTNGPSYAEAASYGELAALAAYLHAIASAGPAVVHRSIIIGHFEISVTSWEADDLGRRVRRDGQGRVVK